MLPLSLPHHKMKQAYDVVVVGSGYGGGIAASRMARADRRFVYSNEAGNFCQEISQTNRPRPCARFKRIQRGLTQADAPVYSTSI